MAADQGLIQGAYRAAMANVQKDYSKFYQAEAAAVAGMAKSLADRFDKLEKQDLKNKESLNKASQETLLAGGSANQLEQKAIETKVTALTEKWEKSSNSERRRIEAEIINIGTKTKAHLANKANYAKLNTNGVLLGSTDYYGIETSDIVMQLKEGDGWKSTVKLDDNNDFVYTTNNYVNTKRGMMGLEYDPGEDDEFVGPRTINSSNWANSFTEDKKQSEKGIATLSTTLENKGIKGLPFSATDNADLLSGIKSTVIPNEFQLQKIISQSRFKGADGELVTFSEALKLEPNVIAALGAVTDPNIISMYDKAKEGNKDGKLTLEDFQEGIKSAALQKMLNNITKPRDPFSGAKNEEYIGFSAAQDIVGGVLRDSLKSEKYDPAFQQYETNKNEIKNTQAVKNLNIQIGNVVKRLSRNIGSNNKSDGVNSLKNIKGAPGIRIDMAPSTGALTQNFQVEEEGKGFVNKSAQISPQDMLDIVFGAGNQNWPDWKTKPGFAATWKKWDDAWNAYIPTEQY